jgi:preprotein translocase subunit SecA
MAEFEFLGRGLKRLFGSRNDRILKQLSPIVGAVNALEPEFNRLTDAQLRAKTAEFRARLEKGEKLDDLLPEAFAAVRESAKRTLGMRHFDVQVIGGIIMHQGKIAEMTTGEGKTLVCTMPAYLNALGRKGVHVVTVNDYLARRDAMWMAPVFRALDMEVGVIQANMMPSVRIPQYRADITYGTNSEFGFDYLRDNMKLRLEDQTQQGVHNFAIVDEVDSILIDEARTPLIIAGAAEQSTEQYYTADRVVKQLEETAHYEVNEKDHHVTLTEEGIDRAQELAGVGSFYEPHNIEWPHHIDQALKANYLYKRDKEYVVDDTEGDPEIVIVDEFTGRKMRGRRWSDGLHQAVEAKEGLQIREENQTLATITYQNFFRLYDKLAGMTGTAVTEAPEFLKIYSLDVLIVPTNRPLRRLQSEDLIYRTEGEKFGAVVEEIDRVHQEGRPILVGTTSVEKSERLSKLLTARGIGHELLNAKHHEREANIVADAGQPGAVTIATNMAGRGTDIILGDGVKAKGGLHVVGTERHEARRIDNQLRGRAGRQGDPGSSQFFLSLEDDLMRIFAKDWVSTMLQKLGMEEGQEIQSPMVSRMIERVQRKMEAHNFDIRKNLLEYDAVNNEQRKVVYGWRQAILEGDDQHERIGRWIEQLCGRLATAHLEIEIESEVGAEEKGPDFEGLVRRWEQVFGTDADVHEAGLDGLATSEVGDLLATAAVRAYEARREGFGADRMAPLERYLLLQTIDDKWKDHLHALDYLRTGVGMRGYGQEDPKVVYRRESASYFQKMIEAVQETVIDLLMRVEPPESTDEIEFDDEPDTGTPMGAVTPSGFDEDAWGEYEDEDDIDWDDVEKMQREAQVRAVEESERRRDAAAAAARAAQQKRTDEALRAAGATTMTAASSPPSGRLRRPSPIASGRPRSAEQPFLTKQGAPKPNDPCSCGSGRKFKKCCGG